MPGTFPSLKTGAVAHYPLSRELRHSAEIVCFLDGSEQAYRNQATVRRRWVVDLALLDDTELGTLKAFFEQQKGAWGTFGFTDPWTGVIFPACSFESDLFPHSQEAENRNTTRLVIYEHA